MPFFVRFMRSAYNVLLGILFPDSQPFPPLTSQHRINMRSPPLPLAAITFFVMAHSRPAPSIHQNVSHWPQDICHICFALVKKGKEVSFTHSAAKICNALFHCLPILPNQAIISIPFPEIVRDSHHGVSPAGTSSMDIHSINPLFLPPVGFTL